MHVFVSACVCVYDCYTRGKREVFGWRVDLGSVAGGVCVCVCNLCVRVCKGVLDHSQIRDCAARYIASRLQLVPWVKFTGLGNHGSQ